MFEIFITGLSFAAGAVASIAGFGIGSLLTPFLTLKVGAKLAIAVISISHFFGTFFRFWKLRSYIHKKVFIHFGILSAIGGLIGAIFHSFISSEEMTLVLGSVLIFSGFMGLFKVSEKLIIKGPVAWAAGVFSGLFGGLVGNQGGIRSAALLNFELSKLSYVATATAIALIVDVSRMPVYFFLEGEKLFELWPLIALMSVGTVLGTFAGAFLLSWIPEAIFKQLVSGVVLVLGFFIFIQGFFF